MEMYLRSLLTLTARWTVPLRAWAAVALVATFLRSNTTLIEILLSIVYLFYAATVTGTRLGYQNWGIKRVSKIRYEMNENELF